VFPILSFIGRSGSGKTTILEKVVTELKERNVKVAVIKHSHHDEIGLDREGKDSWRYTRSGAEIVVVSGNREFILMKIPLR
jgi:molybdopterin-guanine dinucleotide biosynthesis protein B